MADTNIGWTDKVWNPTVGCSRVSAGCENCYAETFANRLEGMGQERYKGLTVVGKHGARWTGEVGQVPEVLAAPLGWRKGRRVFVNSMSDLFHEVVPFEYVAAVFGVMAAAPQHTFQVLTKRPERAVEVLRLGHQGSPRRERRSRNDAGAVLPRACTATRGWLRRHDGRRATRVPNPASAKDSNDCHGTSGEAPKVEDRRADDPCEAKDPGNGTAEQGSAIGLREFTDQPSHQAPPRFRVMGRSGQANRPPAGTWIRRARDARHGGQVTGEARQLRDVGEVSFDGDSWSEGEYDILEPLPVETVSALEARLATADREREEAVAKERARCADATRVADSLKHARQLIEDGADMDQEGRSAARRNGCHGLSFACQGDCGTKRSVML